MATELDIVNSAVVLAGLEPITAVNQPGKTARIVAIRYPMVRDALLREYRWNFTLARVRLTSDGLDTFGIARTFVLPADNARVVAVYDDRVAPAFFATDYRNYTDGRLPWKVEGEHLLANAPTCALIYQRRSVPVGQWDATFNDLLVKRLAAELALAVNGDAGRAAQLTGAASAALLVARRSNAFETTPEIVVASEWTDTRLVGTGIPWVRVP